MGHHFQSVLLDHHRVLHCSHRLPLVYPAMEAGFAPSKLLYSPAKTSQSQTLSLDVGCYHGLRMGHCQYSAGSDDKPRRDDRTAMLDRSFRGGLRPWRCFFPVLLLPAVRNGFPIRVVHFPFADRQLFCVSIGLRYCACEDICCSVAVAVHHR